MSMTDIRAVPMEQKEKQNKGGKKNAYWHQNPSHEDSGSTLFRMNRRRLPINMMYVLAARISRMKILARRISRMNIRQLQANTMLIKKKLK